MHDPALTREALAHLPADIADSPLFNGDLAPVPPGRRTWTTWNFAALWISMAHCLPTYMLAGGLIAMFSSQKMPKVIALGTSRPMTLTPLPMSANAGHAATRKVFTASPPM